MRSLGLRNDVEYIFVHALFQSFPIKEWMRRMSYRTGPCCLVSYQKNGGKECENWTIEKS